MDTVTSTLLKCSVVCFECRKICYRCKYFVYKPCDAYHNIHLIYQMLFLFDGMKAYPHYGDMAKSSRIINCHDLNVDFLILRANLIFSAHFLLTRCKSLSIVK